MNRRRITVLGMAVMLSSLVAACSSNTTTSSHSPITIALVTSLTGTAAPEFSTAPAGFMARIDLQNAEGGVNGHKLVPLVIDDQSTPATVVSGVQDAISKGVFGIVSDSGLFFFAAKYAEEAGVPVTGGYFDGPEWGEPGYTNMFAADTGSVDPKYPVNTGIGLFLAQHGGADLGTYAYSISPSSTDAAIGDQQSFQLAHGKVAVLDTSVPFGGVDFTSEALTAKQDHVDAVVGNLDDDSNIALITALHQAGVDVKVAVFPTGYEPDLITSPSWSQVQGVYFQTLFRPFSLPDAGTEQMDAALKKYENFTSSQFPVFSQYESWLGADLMIKGLEMAGPDPTRAAVIKDLRGVTDWNGDGLLPYTINYSTIFGHDPSQLCLWYMQAEPSGFVPISSTPFCGTDVPGTSTST